MSIELLTRLRLSEVSGVDEGAHTLDGWMVAKRRGDYAEARGEFAALLNDLAARADIDPEPIIAEAMKALPCAVTEPVIQERTMAQAIRKQYGLTKAPHNARDERGRFARKPEGAAAEKAGSMP